MKSSWVETRLGICERRWVQDDQTTSDLAAQAIQQVTHQECPLYLSTISPDYLTPSTASETKRKLQWKGSSSATDLSAACAGFVFALEMGSLFVSHQGEAAAVVAAAEVRSRFLDLQDRRTVFLFADAACAARLDGKSEGSLAQVRWTSCSTEALFAPEILVPAGGAKKPLDEKGLQNKDHKIRMVDGVTISETIEKNLVMKVEQCLSAAQEKISDYSFFVFHQGNGQIIQRILQQLGADESRTHITFNHLGNSSSASLGVTLSEAASLGKMKSKDKVLLVAMGAGYHLGIASITWS